MPLLPVRVPSQRPLAPSVASVTSVANDKDDNEMILGAVQRRLLSRKEFIIDPRFSRGAFSVFFPSSVENIFPLVACT